MLNVFKNNNCMKTNNFYLVIALPLFWMSSNVYSQNTGIGTTNPQAKLHVDGSSDNNATGIPSAAQQANDFVVLNNGNVGVGTIAPSVKLEVKSSGTLSNPKAALKINDGTEADGKVLTSDAKGNTSWKYVAINEIRGVLSQNGASIPLDSKNYYSTGSYIDLAPGRWRVSVTMLLRTTDSKLPNNAWSWVRSTFSDSGSSLESSDLEKPNLLSGMFQGPYKKFALITGSAIINNGTQSTRRYTYIVGNCDYENTGSEGAFKFDAVGSSGYSENIITAFPVL